MPISLTVPAEYGYVLLTATGATFLNFYHSSLVGKFRKASGIKYPNAYATPEQAATSKDAYKFNCAQRAHQNFLESLPFYMTLLVISGLKYPVPAAIAGVAWQVSRVMYANGYVYSTKENGAGRYNGVWGYGPLVGLIGMSIWTSVSMVMET